MEADIAVITALTPVVFPEPGDGWVLLLLPLIRYRLSANQEATIADSSGDSPSH